MPTPTDTTLRLTTRAERWRLACPAGHTGSTLQKRSDGWYCRYCAVENITPTYEFVRDKRSGAFLRPDEVAFD